MTLKKLLKEILASYNTFLEYKAKRGNYYELNDSSIELNDSIESIEKTLLEYGTYNNQQKEFDIIFDDNNTIEDVFNLLNTKHPFWPASQEKLLQSYIKLWEQFRTILIAPDKNSKNLVACNNKTCYSLFQVYNGKLNVYIRSNDFSLGFMNDLYFMCQFAKLFNKAHPNTAIETIKVNWGSLHIYSNNWSQTKEWLIKKSKKGLKFNFN